MNCRLPEEEKVVANGNLQMNIYDLNKQIISQMATLSDEDLEDSKQLIRGYFQEHENEFYMLLCKDISYYTLFHIVDYITEPAAADEVIACIKEIGAVKSIDRTNDGAIEIWAHHGEAQPLAMYLFAYDMGVIECTI